MIIIYTFRRRSLCKWNGKILPGYQRVCRRNPSTKCNWIRWSTYQRFWDRDERRGTPFQHHNRFHRFQTLQNHHRLLKTRKLVSINPQ